MIYVASPYSPQAYEPPHIIYTRHTQVSEYCAHLFKTGSVFYAPITFTHNWAMDYELSTDADSWAGFNTYYMDLCDELHVLMLAGWETSKGVQHEIEYFKKNNKPIKYIQSGYYEVKRG